MAQARLHLDDITGLADSPLVELPIIRRRWEGHRTLFAEGQALREVLEDIVRGLIHRLAGEGKTREPSPGPVGNWPHNWWPMSWQR